MLLIEYEPLQVAIPTPWKLLACDMFGVARFWRFVMKVTAGQEGAGDFHWFWHGTFSVIFYLGVPGLHSLTPCRLNMRRGQADE